MSQEGAMSHTKEMIKLPKNPCSQQGQEGANFNAKEIKKLPKNPCSPRSQEGEAESI